MSEAKTYEIGDQTYELAPPVYGVMERIVLFNLRVSKAVVSDGDLLDLVSMETPAFAAELITPQGTHVKDRVVADAVEALRWASSSSLLKEIVEDFFEQPGADVEEIMATSGVIRQVKTMVAGRTGLQQPSSSPMKSVSSPEATSSSATASGGKSAPETPEPT